MDDASLTETFAQLQRGDPNAFALLYDATIAKVFALVLRVTGNYADAEEVTNDVYQQLWRTAGRFDPRRGSALQWIVVIARSRALDQLRKSYSGAARLARRDALYVADSAPTAEEIVQRFERGTLVHAALSGLRDLEVQLIGLAFFEGLSHRELAVRVGMPLGTVKSSIRRALAALRDALSSADSPTIHRIEHEQHAHTTCPAHSASLAAGIAP